MATRFQEKLNARREEERRKQLKAEWAARERAEKQAEERRAARDRELKEEQRLARLAEETRSRQQEQLRAEALRNDIERQQRENKASQFRNLRRAKRQSQNAAAARKQENQEHARQEQSRALLKQRRREARSGAGRENLRLVLRTQPAAPRRQKPARTAIGDEQRKRRTAITEEKRRVVRQQQLARQRREKQSRATAADRPRPPHEQARPSTSQLEQRAAHRIQTQSRQRKKQQRADALREEQLRIRARQARQQRRQELAAESARERKLAARQAAQRSPQPQPEPAPAAKPQPPRRRKVAERRAQARAAAARAAAQQAPPAEPPSPEEPLDSLPWLKTRGSFLVDEYQNPIYLRGVTCRGLDGIAPSAGQQFRDALALDDPNLSTLTGLWGVNVIRLPFQPQTILSGTSTLSPNDLLAGLDDTVAAITQAGAYVLLSMQPAMGDSSIPAPGSDVFQAWSLLANHYQDEPGVLYELFSVTSALPNGWLDAAMIVIGAVRLANPSSLIFVGNGAASSDVTGLPLRFSTGDPVFNVAYTISVAASQFPDPNDTQLRSLAASYPVFASPWSDGAADFGRSAEEAANLFERYGMGWLAENWNAEPSLVTNAASHDFAPTRWGLVVQRAMAQPVKPLLPSLRVEDDAASAWRLGK